VSFASFDPGTSSWRTSQLSLLEEWSAFSGTWPRAGMTRSGTAYRLRPLAPLTAVTGSGLLPTPKATDADRGGRGDLLQVARGNPSPSGHFKWPTPHGICAPGPRRPGPSGNELGRAVNEAERQTWPTPTARDWKDTGDLTGVPERSGSLNPTWVEWLMGFPSGFTELETLTPAHGGTESPTFPESLPESPSVSTDSGA
jgi:hypothetical protein